VARVDPDRTVYVYGLHTDRDDTVMYVGCSVNPERRRKQHISDALLARRMGYDIRPVSAWILNQVDNGEPVAVSVLDSCKAVDATLAESNWIIKARSANPGLLNDKKAPAYCNHATSAPKGMAPVKLVSPGDTVFQAQKVYANGYRIDTVTPSRIIETGPYGRVLIGGLINGTYKERWVSTHYLYQPLKADLLHYEPNRN
jgi:hypothetical protein